MNAIEELLSEAMTDVGQDGPSVEADWDRVTSAVATRQRRRANTYRIGVVLLIVVLGLGVLTSRFGLVVDTIADPAETPEPVVEVPEVGIWPSAQDVVDAAGERPQIQFWIAWLFGAGLPFLAALNAWARAPKHLRVPIASQRVARIVLASSAALAATVAVGLAAGAVLFFTYDPLAALSGTSYVLSVLGVVELSFFATAIALSLSLALSNGGSEEGVVRRVLNSVFALFVTFGVAGAFVGIVFFWFDWRTTEGVDGPVRGLWRLFFQGDVVFGGSPGVITSLSTVLATVAALGGAAVFLWVAKTSARNVLAGAGLEPVVRRSSSTDAAPISRSVRVAVTVLVMLAAALPTYVYVQKDVAAQSIAHIVTLPPDVADAQDIRSERDFRVERDIDRGLFEQLDLVEVAFIIPNTQTPLDQITDEQLLPERFGFDHRGEEVTVRNRGLGFGNELWSVERDEPRRTITVSVRREVAVPGLNTALFISSLLILIATSTWIPKMISKQDIEPRTIPGRRMGAWFVIVASAAIGVHLVASLIGLEADVGNRASRGGLSLYEIYTLRPEPTPHSLDDLSPWFLLLNVFTFAPVFALATLGVRRLTRSPRITRAMLVSALISAALTWVLWGQLILDWVDWFLD